MWEDSETDMRHLEKIGTNKGIAIGVRTNLGLLAQNMSRWNDEVYAFEVNDDLTEPLKAYWSENINVFKKWTRNL